MTLGRHYNRNFQIPSRNVGPFFNQLKHIFHAITQKCNFLIVIVKLKFWFSRDLFNYLVLLLNWQKCLTFFGQSLLFLTIVKRATGELADMIRPASLHALLRISRLLTQCIKNEVLFKIFYILSISLKAIQIYIRIFCNKWMNYYFWKHNIMNIFSEVLENNWYIFITFELSIDWGCFTRS